MRIIFKVPEERKVVLIASANKCSKTIVEGFYYVGCKLIKYNNKLIIS
jgi:hypothetical protein